MITSRPRKTLELEFEDGTKPFGKWFSKLKDIEAKAQIRKRIRQAEEGNFGNYRSLGSGVFELKIFKNPGYRIYFGIDGDNLMIILMAGDKSSQDRDIEKAKELWQYYLESKRS